MTDLIELTYNKPKTKDIYKECPYCHEIIKVYYTTTGRASYLCLHLAKYNSICFGSDLMMSLDCRAPTQ